MDQRKDHRLGLPSGMLQSWNKFCFTTGYIGASVSMPGRNSNAQGIGWVYGLWGILDGRDTELRMMERGRTLMTRATLARSRTRRFAMDRVLWRLCTPAMGGLGTTMNSRSYLVRNSVCVHVQEGIIQRRQISLGSTRSLGGARWRLISLRGRRISLSMVGRYRRVRSLRLSIMIIRRNRNI
jgi:hypothetical protein